MSVCPLRGSGRRDATVGAEVRASGADRLPRMEAIPNNPAADRDGSDRNVNPFATFSQIAPRPKRGGCSWLFPALRALGVVSRNHPSN